MAGVQCFAGEYPYTISQNILNRVHSMVSSGWSGWSGGEWDWNVQGGLALQPAAISEESTNSIARSLREVSKQVGSPASKH